MQRRLGLGRDPTLLGGRRLPPRRLRSTAVLVASGIPDRLGGLVVLANRRPTDIQHLTRRQTNPLARELIGRVVLGRRIAESIAIQRCLDKSPDRRFADAAELATALSQIVPVEPSHRAPPRPPRVSLPPASSFETLPPVAGTIAPPRPAWSRRFVALAALGVALIAATFAVKQLRPSQHRAELLPRAIARAADSAASDLSSEASATPVDVPPEEEADEAPPTAEPAAPPQLHRAATARATTPPPPRPARRRPGAPSPSASAAPQQPSFKVPLWGRD